jgi:hypothetical protein
VEYPGSFNEDMTIAGGRVFMGGLNPMGTVPGLMALDPSQLGVDSVVTSSQPRSLRRRPLLSNQ